jgi:hypothetical protein
VKPLSRGAAGRAGGAIQHATTAPTGGWRSPPQHTKTRCAAP